MEKTPFFVGKSTISMEKSPFFMGKSAISMGHGFKFASCKRHYQAGSTFPKLLIFLGICQKFHGFSSCLLGGELPTARFCGL